MPALREENSPFTGSRAEWKTAFYKTAVSGKVEVGTTNIAGDGQADLRYHGGMDKAVCVYPSEHYPFWRQALGFPIMEWGAFGENLSTEGLTEETVCLGDLFQSGETLFEISQPRQPCWKLARRWGIKNLAQLVEEQGFTGWYFRVRKPGFISNGTPLLLIERPFPAWTIARTNQIMYRDLDDLQSALFLSECSVLSGSWRRVFAGRVVPGLNA